MMTIFSPQTKNAFALIAKFHEPFENIFPIIAEQIAFLSNHLDGFSKSINALVNSSVESSLESAMGTIQGLAGEVVGFVRKEEEGQYYLSRLAFSLLEHLDTISKAFQLVDVVAKRLRITGLNASIVASRAGTKNEAFIVLSRELVVITRDSESEARHVQQINSSIFDATQGVVEIHRQMKQELVKLLERTECTTESSCRSVISLLDGTKHGIASAYERIHDIDEPISKLMHAIQNEDILRQYLDHIQMVLSELENYYSEVDMNNMSDKIEYLHFQAGAGNLCADLVDDILKKIDSLYVPLIECLGQVYYASSKFMENDQLSQHEEKREKLVQKAMASLESLVQILINIENKQSVFDDHSKETEVIVEGIRVLESHFHKLEQFSDGLRNIRILLSLEIDRSSMLARGRAILPVISSARETLLEQLATVSKPLRLLHDTARKLNLALEETNFKRQEQAKAFKHLLQGNIDIARKYWAQFFAELDDLVEVSSAIRKKAHHFTEILEKSRAEWNGFLQLKTECLAISKQAREQLHSHGCSPSDIMSSRLQMLADRFTVSAHKEIAGNLGNWEVEKGDVGGSLTLF